MRNSGSTVIRLSEISIDSILFASVVPLALIGGILEILLKLFGAILVQLHYSIIDQTLDLLIE